MDPDQLIVALDLIGAGMPIREAARLFHVSKDYPRRRLEGIITRKAFKTTRQVISPDLEQQLADWALLQARLGWAPPHSRFRLFAQMLVMASGSEHRLGKNLHTAFFKWNPSVRSVRSTRIDFLRVNGAS